MKITNTALAAAAAILFAFPAAAQTGGSNPNPMAAQATATGSAAPDAMNFTATAAMGNQFEIESSQLAEQKARDPKVKTFAREMIRDHGKAGQKLMSVAAKANVTIPETKTLDERHRQQLASLNASQNFDRDYVQAQVQAHQETVALFQAYSRDGDNRDLKRFAGNTLPTLRKHLREIETLAR